LMDSDLEEKQREHSAEQNDLKSLKQQVARFKMNELDLNH